jgi:rubrerythrin
MYICIVCYSIYFTPTDDECPNCEDVQIMDYDEYLERKKLLEEQGVDYDDQTSI